MTELNLKALISKLDHIAKDLIEESLACCVRYQNYNVELVHVLFALMQKCPELVDDVGGAHELLLKDVFVSLECLDKGNTQAPAFSPRVVNLINEAWTVATITYGKNDISCVNILEAMLVNDLLCQLSAGISSEMSKLDLSLIRELGGADVTKNDSLVSDKSKKNSLDEYAINLNEQAKLGKIDAVIGRDDEIRQMIDVLSRRRQNNAVLTGDPGVGKTAIVEGLAKKIVLGDVPDSLQSVVIYALDLGLLQAGASVKGEFERRLKSIISSVKSSASPIVLFIDEAHTLIGSGGSVGGSDAANLLKPALARGELRCIAATTWDEYRQYFEKDPALVRRFQVVKIDEPSTGNAISMLRSLAYTLEKHHQVKIMDSAIIKATVLSRQYIANRQLPDKSIAVLDTACARVAASQKTIPRKIESLTKLNEQLELEHKRLQIDVKLSDKIRERCFSIKDQIKNNLNEIKSFKSQWAEEKAIVKSITALVAKLEADGADDSSDSSTEINDLLLSLAAIQESEPLVIPVVDEYAVCEVISDWTGVPVGRMSVDAVSKVFDLKNSLSSCVIGQELAIESLSNSLKISLTQLSDPNKPNGVFMLLGPSGVGKTETAMVLAENLYGSRDKITVINMSEFKEEHKVSMLTGSPPGYVGYGEGGVLTEAARRSPYSLILLDEIEKAHPGVQDVFYQLFDKGIIKDGQGRDIDFRNTTILMTSNACADEIEALDKSDSCYYDVGDVVNQIQPCLRNYFKPAFLGRVSLIPYFSLSSVDLKEIIQLKLAKVVDRIVHEHGVSLHFAPAVVDSIAQMCVVASIGARQIDNVINKKLLPQLSTILLNAMADQSQLSTISVESRDNEMIFTVSYVAENDMEEEKKNDTIINEI